MYETNHRLRRRPWNDEWAVIEIANRHFACSTCGADSGESCRFLDGSGRDHGYVYAHEARRRALDGIYQRGYALGYQRGRDAKRIRRAAA